MFLISAALLCCSSLVIATRTSESLREGFWIFIAAMAMQIGIISEVISLANHLEPQAWLGAQVLSFLAILTVLRLFRTTLAHDRAIVEGSDERKTILLKYRPVLGPIPIALLICIAGIVLFSFITRYLMPIDDFDSKMYHASRVLYWLQNRSIFPYITHNFRQVVFPFGSELFFLWPVLFTKSELIGRLVFWLGYPLAGVGLYILLRQLCVETKLSLLGSFVFVATPIISRYAITLKPEMWQVVFLLGAAFWLVRCCQEGNPAGKNLFLVGLFSVLSINIRFTGLFLAPAVFVALLVTARKLTLVERAKYLLGGVVVGVLLSGLVVTTGFNLANYGHPLGPERVRAIHQADLSLTQSYVQGVRFVFLLLEFPAIPIAPLREFIEKVGNKSIDLIGADRLLPLENTEGWPGAYSYQVSTVASRFSLGGLIWLPCLFIGIVGFIREVRQTYPAVRISAISILVILQLPLLWGDVFVVRWMANSGVPDRLILGPYALGIALTMFLLSKFVYTHKVAGTIVVLLTMSLMGIHLRSQYRVTSHILASPTIMATPDRRYSEALSHIPVGAHILFVGAQDATDYSFFAPFNGYANRVIPWGKLPFERQRMQELINLNRIEYVLIESASGLEFSTVAREMILWLSSESKFRSVDLQTKASRLFEVLAGSKGGDLVKKD